MKYAVVFLSLLISVHSALFYFAVVFLQGVPWAWILAISAVFSFYLTSFAKQPESKDSWKTWLVSVSGFCLFLLPALPLIFPLSDRWDGANHMAILRFLHFHDGHRISMDNYFQLSWGGDLTSYPWGFHSLCVALAKVFGTDPEFMIQPMLSLLIALILGMVFQSERGIAGKFFAFFVAYLSSVHLINMNYWTQIAGIFMLFGLLEALRWNATPHLSTALIGLILGGVTLVYPLLTAPAFATVGAIVISRHHLSRAALVAALGMGAAISLFYVWPHWNANIERLTLRHGPTAAPWAIWFLPVWAGLILSAFIQARRTQRQDFILVSAIGLTLISLMLMKSTSYWEWKIILSSFFFLIPVATVFLNRIKLFKAIFALAVVSSVLFFPKNVWIPPPPALTADDFQLIAWLRADHEAVNAHVLAHPFKISWLEALAYPRSFQVPPDLKDLAIQFGRQYDPHKLNARLIPNPRTGDIVVSQIEPNFSLFHSRLIQKIASWGVYRLTSGTSP